VSTESLAVVAAGFSVLALLVVVALAVQVGRLRRAYDGLVAGAEGSSFVSAVGRQTAAAAALRDDVQQLRDELAAARADTAGGLRRAAVVRYDAFGDLGGALSFSVALLDDAGDGLVLTCINGRSETRTYAKGITGGTGDVALSPEEQEAVEQAGAPLGRVPQARR